MANKPPVIAEYEIKESFNAPRINLKPGEAMSYKPFAKGVVVKGFLYENEDPKAELSPNIKTIITEDMLYAIPMRVIYQPGVDATAADKIPLDIKSRLDSIKSSDIVGNIVKNSQNVSGGFITGAFIGALIGVFSQKTVVSCAVLGGLTGAGIGYLLSKRQQFMKPVETTAVIINQDPDKKL